MKKYALIISILFCSGFSLMAQDVTVWLKEAENFERSLKELEALDKYKQVLTANPTHLFALVKTTELSCAIGGRLENKNDKRLQYESAFAFAKRAYKTDSNSADANYIMAMVSGKMTEIETDNKKIVAFARDTKIYIDKALLINPNHPKANFTLGRWHYEMVTLSTLKKAAVKVFFGGLQSASIDNAIAYLEKSKSIDPYYMLTYYYLNKAYQEENRLPKQIEILNKMVKLPTRCFDDIQMKSEAMKQLQSLQ